MASKDQELFNFSCSLDFGEPCSPTLYPGVAVLAGGVNMTVAYIEGHFWVGEVMALHCSSLGDGAYNSKDMS